MSVLQTSSGDVCRAPEDPLMDREFPNHIDISMMPWNEVLKLQRAEAKRNRPPDVPVRSRKAFYASQKKAVCEMYVANPDVSHKELADLFGVDRSMITRTLREKERWLKSKHVSDQEFARKRVNKSRQIERVLKTWLLTCREQGIAVSDTIIKQKAISVAEQKGMFGGGHVYQFTGGRKWLRAFKERFGIVDGVATRLGFSETDLAREKAYGDFPLDEPFWSELPDEDGNIVGPDPFCISVCDLDEMDFELHGRVAVYKVRQASSVSQPVASDSNSPVANPANTPPIVPNTADVSVSGFNTPSSSTSFCTPDYADLGFHQFSGSSDLPSFPLPGASSTQLPSPEALRLPAPPPYVPPHASPDAAMLLSSLPDICAAPRPSSTFLEESIPLAGPLDPLDMTTRPLHALSLSSFVLPGMTCSPSLASNSSGLNMYIPRTTTPDMSASLLPELDSSGIPSPTSSSPATPPSHPLLSCDHSIAHSWPSTRGDGTLPLTVGLSHNPPHFATSSGDALANEMCQPPSDWPVFENDNFLMQKYAWSQAPELPRAYETSLGSYVDSMATQWSM